jgi:ParB family chromosome partitioning protein
MMRLTKLPEDVQAHIVSGQLSAGHARALLAVPDPSAAAKRIIAEGLNVRQVETLVHEIAGSTPKHRNSRGALVKDPDTLALEKRVGDILGLSVKVDHKGPSGTMHIKYRDLEQLDEILRRLDSKV